MFLLQLVLAISSVIEPVAVSGGTGGSDPIAHSSAYDNGHQ
jgi:hypothetical protein